MDLPTMDYGAARFWMDALQVGGLLALGLYQHLTNKAKANTSAINTVRGDLERLYGRLEQRIGRSERRQDVFESQMAGAPTHQDLAKLHERLNSVAEDLSDAGGQMRALSHQLSMVNEYLLNSKGANR